MADNREREARYAGKDTGGGMASEGGATALRIGPDAVVKAREIFERCRRGKANLDARVADNETWYRMRYDPYEGHRDPKDAAMARERNAFKTASGWLFNNIANKHADAMDNYPRPNILPREAGDEAEARLLSAIIPALLQNEHFEDTYSDVQYDKIKSGTGVYGVFWDGSAYGGLGEIAIREIDILSIFWDPGVQDIQDSRHVFLTTVYDREAVEEMYPQLVGKLGGGYDVASGRDYINDDDTERARKVAIVDWYYKRHRGGRTVVHLCRFCGSEVLYASENDPTMAEEGFYAHGKFPFVLDVLYPIKNSPAGFGAVDICRNPQMYIDRLDTAIMENAIGGAKPRYWVKKSMRVQKEDFADFTNQVVEYEGDPGGILPMVTKELSPTYQTVLEGKITELKEIAGNRDATTGGTASGVTAASAIAAMIETGSKLSRDSSRSSYRAFRQVVELMVELIRQFYDTPRKFRIVGADGMAEFVTYTNAGLMMQPMEESYARTPLFDIEITAERSSPYTRMSQNELMLQLYGAGFFTPGNADASLAAMDGMSFDQKEAVRRRIERNGTLFEINRQLMMTNQALAAQLGGEVAGAVQTQNADAAAVMATVNNTATTVTAENEPTHMSRVKQQVADSTTPT